MNFFVLSLVVFTTGLFDGPTLPQRFVAAAFANVSVSDRVQSASDASLAAVRREDKNARNARGVMTRLSPEEHLRRAAIYHSNRAFDEAREHWNAFMTYYPNDPRVAEALLGTGRSYFQSRRYADSYEYYDRLARTYPATKEGREGLNFSAAALLRMGRTSDAADRYIEYINRFPTGERIDTAHLNAIDTLREAGRSQEAMSWVARTRQRFPRTSVEANAIFGQLRLDVAEGNWTRAAATADELTRNGFPRGIATTPSEVTYLKAYSLDRAGNREQAIAAYLAIPSGIDSYYGWLANDQLNKLLPNDRRGALADRLSRNESQASNAADRYPAPYRSALLSAAKARKVDPRFLLALIRQESVFRPLAKSPAGARGLLQLTIDAAQKYATNAGINDLRENRLYQPETSIAIGSEYIKELFDMFPDMPEAVAASYNGGEDNVARWVRRAQHKDAGVFTSEIGFDETKNYVQKVMNNYRVYRQLYNADLTTR